MRGSHTDPHNRLSSPRVGAYSKPHAILKEVQQINGTTHPAIIRCSFLPLCRVLEKKRKEKNQ